MAFRKLAKLSKLCPFIHDMRITIIIILKRLSLIEELLYASHLASLTKTIFNKPIKPIRFSELRHIKGFL